MPILDPPFAGFTKHRYEIVASIPWRTPAGSGRQSDLETTTSSATGMPSWRKIGRLVHAQRARGTPLRTVYAYELQQP